MPFELEKMSEGELLSLSIRYKKLIAEEPDTTFAEHIREHRNQVLAELDRRKAALQCG